MRAEFMEIARGGSRALIVGEACQQGHVPLDASTTTGARMRRLLGQDLAGCARVNLLPPQPRDGKGSAFDARLAGGEAFELKVALTQSKVDRVVLLGWRVTEAMQMPLGSYFDWSSVPLVVQSRARLVRVVTMPHPSGIVRWWNERGAEALASKQLFKFLREGSL
jgi:hypothetical protein